MLDRQAHGTDHMLNRTHCPNGHAYSPENTNDIGRHRQCRACRKDRKREHYLRVKDTKVCCLNCDAVVAVWSFANHERNWCRAVSRRAA